MNRPIDRRSFLKETAAGLTFALTVAADPRALTGEALMSEAAAAPTAESGPESGPLAIVCGGGSLPFAGNMPGGLIPAALAQGQPPRRRSLEGLAWNDPIVATYRDALPATEAQS